jgi:hypothetical protein
VSAQRAWPTDPNEDNAAIEGALEGVLEDVRILPDGYAELDLRTAEGEVVTILLTPEAFAEIFNGQTDAVHLPN